ncbi:MAG: Gfo/Idh/MocA family oxidoreductase [Planctomycetales bacterium]|nr:Gfo/Idh/MocA family oxidoreductase [Planctomycetales bacterium]
MKLKIGLIGLSGDWQKRYLPALRILKDRFEVTGVYCSVAMLAENVSREFEAPRFDGFREMIRHPDIDAVMMLSSDWYGTLPIQAACDYGKAVYCGSEIDFDPNQAATLAQLVDKSGIAFMAEFPRRYAPASLRLKELIATRLGNPQLLFCHRRLPSLPTETTRRTARTLAARSDRELLELLDWCSFIVGRRPRSVLSISHLAGPTLAEQTQTDYQLMSVDFSPTECPLGTTVAQISCGSYIRSSWQEAATFRPPAAMQAACEKGIAFLDLPSGLTWFDDAGRHQESLDSEVGVGQQLLTQFHRAVTSLVRKIGDLEDVTAGMQTLAAARRSLASRQVIEL